MSALTAAPRGANAITAAGITLRAKQRPTQRRDLLR